MNSMERKLGLKSRLSLIMTGYKKKPSNKNGYYGVIADTDRSESPNSMEDEEIYDISKRKKEDLKEKSYNPSSFRLFNGVVSQTSRRYSYIQLCDKITSEKEKCCRDKRSMSSYSLVITIERRMEEKILGNERKMNKPFYKKV